MKVLVLSNMGPKPSAPFLGLFVERQVQRLQERLPELSYFRLNWNGDSLFHKLFKYPLFFIQFFFRHIVSRTRYDLIHVHYYYPTIWLALAYKCLRNPAAKILVTCHGGDIYCYQPPGLLYRFASRFVDHWIFTSTKLAERFFNPEVSHQILCAGFDDRVFFLDQMHNGKNIDCLLIGHLDGNKGIDRLIKLVDRLPQFKFVAVGRGPYAETLQRLENEKPNFKLMGAQAPKELSDVVANSRLLLSLSRNESFGLVISEAHASGVPCIATRTDGSEAQIHDRDFLVSQRTEAELIEELSERIEQYLSTSEENQLKVGKRVSEQAESYSLTRVCDTLNDCYAKMLGKGSHV